MAAATRVCGVIFHSDRGSDYTSRKFARACRRLGVTRSMGRVGSCFGKAVSEAFNSVLKVEYVHLHTFRTRTEARIRIATRITDFYNTCRLHSLCGSKSPNDYENEYGAGLTVGLGCVGRTPQYEGIDTAAHDHYRNHPADALRELGLT
jgi:putative transposase